jgi:hypothetical protein
MTITRIHNISLQHTRKMDLRNIISTTTGSMFYPDTDSKTYPVRGMYSWLKKLPVIYSALKLNWLIFEHYSLCYTVLAACFAIVIFAMGFVGNILVIIVVLKRRSMHTTTNCYLFSLALADLLSVVYVSLNVVLIISTTTGSMFYPDTDSKTYPVRGMYSWLKKLPVILSWCIIIISIFP